MQLVIEDFEKQSPVILTRDPMTDDEFAEFCAQYPDCRIESTAQGEMLIMPPNYTRTGQRKLEIAMQLGIWTRKDGRGKAFDSSTGYVLPNGARRSPDASWVSLSTIASIPREQLDRYWHIAPEFVIELKSPTDRLRQLHAKLREWIDNGVQLAWLIDPESKTVWIYSPSSVLELLNPTSLDGEGPVAGFCLDLTEVWAH